MYYHKLFILVHKLMVQQTRILALYVMYFDLEEMLPKLYFLTRRASPVLLTEVEFDTRDTGVCISNEKLV